VYLRTGELAGRQGPSLIKRVLELSQIRNAHNWGWSGGVGCGVQSGVFVSDFLVLSGIKLRERS